MRIPTRYPARDEVVAYLRRYASNIDADTRAGVRVTGANRRPDGAYLVRASSGEEFAGVGVVAASGSFGSLHLPVLPGQDDYGGELRHVAHYRRPEPYASKRVGITGFASPGRTSCRGQCSPV
ncbi:MULTISPECIES: hypothetical protein [Micromonospora]|uniref:hypothetical protein n=1 Tax=Micromonospora TaxID=1873 RepID=UPI0018F47BA0|nr:MULTISPECIES: hypothetical protein [Micromonospora]